MTFRSLGLCVALLLPVVVVAQDDRSRISGVVTDNSGGALPGVTVVLRGASGAPMTVFTDGAGRYLTGWVAPGGYTITLDLSGFESQTISFKLAPGQTLTLDRQLSLAPLSERVEVVAIAPKPPAPDPPPPPRRPRPQPVDAELLASVCGPRQAPDFSLSVGHILSHRDDPNRQLIGPGDLLRIDAGESQGVTVGQNFVIRRRFQTGDRSASKKIATYAEQSAGLIQVIEVERTQSTALVARACGELMAGDSVERHIGQPAFAGVLPGTPRFDEPARVVTGEHGQEMSAPGQMMVIDRGVMQGVQRGQQLTLFRREGSVPLVIGDGIVIALRPDSSTIRIERARDGVRVGDLAALHR